MANVLSVPLRATAVSADHAPMLISLQFFTFVLCGFPPLLQLSVLLLDFSLSRAPHTSTAPLPLINFSLSATSLTVLVRLRSARKLLCVRCDRHSMFHVATTLKCQELIPQHGWLEPRMRVILCKLNTEVCHKILTTLGE